MKRTIFLVFVLIGWFVIQPINAIKKTVNVPEAGKLKSLVDKKELSTITELCITGDISDKDVKFMEGMTNLEVLDLSKANGDITYLPPFERLRVLFLNPKSRNYGSKEVKGVRVSVESCISNFKNLEVIYARKEQLANVQTLGRLKVVGIYDNNWFHESISTLAKIDTLVIWDDKDGYFQEHKNYGGFIPKIIINATTNETILPFYDPNRQDYKGINILPLVSKRSEPVHTSRILDLSDVHFIPHNYFAGAEMDSVVFSDQLRYVSGGAFDKCPNLQKLTFRNKTSGLILDGSSYESNIKYFHFMGPVIFINKHDPKYATYIFDAPSIVRFGNCEFSHLVFNALPEKFECEKANNSFVYVPKGEKDKYAAVLNRNGNNFVVLEQGTEMKSYNIKMEKPGTILSHLPMKELLYIDSLTITGTLYETDLAVIEKCKMLSYLDIGHTFITISPEKRQAQRQAAQEWSALFSLIGAMADAKYENGEMMSEDYVYTKLFTELAKQPSEIEASDGLSFELSNAFNNMQMLKTVILPFRAKSIVNCFNDCVRLEQVQIPLYIENLSGFNRCFSLKEANFPATITNLSGFECTAFEIVDLSHITFAVNSRNYTDWTGAFKDCPNLKELHLPQGITRYEGWFDFNLNHRDNRCKIYFPKSFKYLRSNGFRNNELHFSSETAPTGNFDIRGNCIVYCPKGSTTSYYIALGNEANSVEIIEE